MILISTYSNSEVRDISGFRLLPGHSRRYVLIAVSISREIDMIGGS